MNGSDYAGGDNVTCDPVISWRTELDHIAYAPLAGHEDVMFANPRLLAEELIESRGD